MRQELRPTLLLLRGRGGARAARRLRQRRQPDADARHAPLAGAAAARRARRHADAASHRQLLAENASAVCAGVVLGLLFAQVALRALTVYVQRSTSLPVDHGLTVGAVVCAAAVSIVLSCRWRRRCRCSPRRSGEGASGAAARPPAQRTRRRPGRAVVRADDRGGARGAEPAAPAGHRHRLHHRRRADDARRSEFQQVPRRPVDRRVLAGGRAAGFRDFLVWLALAAPEWCRSTASGWPRRLIPSRAAPAG